MTLTLILLCGAAAAIVAFGTSALVLLAVIAGRRALAARSPAGQARILLGLALLPLLVTIAVLAAALAPSFGWIADHCFPVSDPHGHPHICVHHHSVLPALPLMVAAGFLALRAAVAVARLVLLGRSLARARRALTDQARATAEGAHVLPIELPQAFVLGVVRPRLFITRGLLRPRYRDHLQAVLAHERAHLQRRDPVRRLCAAVGFAFHLPGVNAVLERRLACAHEMAADDAAAEAVGSRASVARALVELSRAGAAAPRAALAFAGADVEVRVRALVDATERGPGPRPRTLMAIATLGVLAVAAGADLVHHGIESALGLFGG